MAAATQQQQQQYPLLSSDRRKEIAIARYQAFETRPTTVAAKEFFNGDGINGTRRKANNWRSLPQRVRRLCQVLENWVSMKTR